VPLPQRENFTTLSKFRSRQCGGNRDEQRETPQIFDEMKIDGDSGSTALRLDPTAFRR